jgi:hypothetical protein
MMVRRAMAPRVHVDVTGMAEWVAAGVAKNRCWKFLEALNAIYFAICEILLANFFIFGILCRFTNQSIATHRSSGPGNLSSIPPFSREGFQKLSEQQNDSRGEILDSKNPRNFQHA